MTDPAENRVNRVLLVENSPTRVDVLEGWRPDDFQFVVVRSGNAALGVLRRDPGKVYAGIMLDFDLDAIVQNDLRTGMDVALAMVRHVDQDVPVLVHSMNPGGANEAARVLRGAGFDVTRIPFSDLHEEDLLEWLDDCRC